MTRKCTMKGLIGFPSIKSIDNLPIVFGFVHALYVLIYVTVWLVLHTNPCLEIIHGFKYGRVQKYVIPNWTLLLVIVLMYVLSGGDCNPAVKDPFLRSRFVWKSKKLTPCSISTKKLSKTKLQWHLPTASSKGKKSIWVLTKENMKWSEVNHWKVLNFCIWGHMGYSASGSDRLRQWWLKSNIRSL